MWENLSRALRQHLHAVEGAVGEWLRVRMDLWATLVQFLKSLGVRRGEDRRAHMVLHGMDSRDREDSHFVSHEGGVYTDSLNMEVRARTVMRSRVWLAEASLKVQPEG